MHPYPHRYAVRAEGTDAGRVTLHAEDAAGLGL